MRQASQPASQAAATTMAAAALAEAVKADRPSLYGERVC